MPSSNGFHRPKSLAAKRVACALGCLLLLPSSVKAQEVVRTRPAVQFMVMIGRGGTWSANLASWPALQVGGSVRLGKHLTAEAMGGYHDLGENDVTFYYPGSDLDPSSSSRLTIHSWVAGLTLSQTDGLPGFFLSAGPALYSVRRSFVDPRARNRSRTRPGFSIASGLKVPTGSWSPRFDVRLHALPLDLYTPIQSKAPWLRLYEASIGVEFP